MRTVKIVSKILFYFMRVLFIFYIALSVYSIITFITGWSIEFSGNGKYFHVCYPFTSAHFLNGENNVPYIVFDFLSSLTLYGLFFLLLSNVFRVFFQPKLFTEFGVKHLKRFYLANFIMPSVAVFLANVFSESDDMSIMLIFAHAIMGVFAYFLATIFTQGVNLQHEQDLII